MRQLDLLDWKPAAAIAAFPPARRVRLVRSTALELAELEPEAGLQHWRQVVHEIVNPLLEAGIHADAVRTEMVAFREAVADEMSRIEDEGPDGDPGQRLQCM